VKQIVGGTLKDGEEPSTNFVSDRSPSDYARMYQEDKLTGGHVIMLGPGNERAAKEALAAWPGGLQIGGGMNAENAKLWLEAGAAAIIVTSAVFRDGQINLDQLEKIFRAVGKERLVLDLSCRKHEGRYWVATDRWQKLTQVEVTAQNLNWLSEYCAEFLIHAADVEGLQQGIDGELVERLGSCVEIPTTYAGGVRDLDDFKRINQLADGKLDATIGSALDIFGGTLPYREVVLLSNTFKENSTGV
jgi:phosphoribosylformimino-5-aminoimidazole carboxamide ribotide isomerase